MDNILNATVVFIAIFSISILIERFLEILKSVFDLLDSRLDWYRFWTKRAEALKDSLIKRVRIQQYMGPDALNRILNSFRHLLLGPEDNYTGTIPMISGDLIRMLYVRVGTKTIGMICGIILALYFRLDIMQLMAHYLNTTMDSYLANNFIRLPETSAINPIVTGIIAGLGAEPVHKLITVIERRRETGGKGAAK